MTKKNVDNSHGFSLIELIIVIAIIAVLTGICIPVYLSHLEKSRTTACMANRHSLLDNVSALATEKEQDKHTIFTEMDLSIKSQYRCPEGGVFSWKDGRIICSKHPDEVKEENNNAAEGISVGNGKYPSVILDDNIDSTVRVKGDSLAVEKGRIYKIGESYYVGMGNYSAREVNSDNYEKWLTDTYTVKKVNFDNTYNQEQLGTEAKLNDYSKTGAKVGIGSVYEFDDKLYVQMASFTGNTPTQSSDPTVNPTYWTLLGTIEKE